ncbi:MAG: hypothetical protein K8R76_04640 [Candidatus Aegiribacteria sp.]|nr:hypothetical protein [Candidatus Aegiribacteria sp.]
MFKTTSFMLILIMVGSSGIILAAGDCDNNGIPDDELFANPGTFEGESNRDVTIIFPTSSDTWQLVYYPYWWNSGDTVFGTHTISEDNVDHAEITILLTTNTLITGGYCNIDFRIDGNTCGSFQILPEDGLGPITESFDFTALPAGTHELRYFSTNKVAPGCGSIVWNVTGSNSVVFSGGSSLDDSTWGMIKSAF